MFSRLFQQFILLFFHFEIYIKKKEDFYDNPYEIIEEDCLENPYEIPKKEEKNEKEIVYFTKNMYKPKTVT